MHSLFQMLQKQNDIVLHLGFLSVSFFDVLALLAFAGLPNQKLSRYLKYIAEKQGITNAELNAIHV